MLRCFSLHLEFLNIGSCFICTYEPQSAPNRNARASYDYHVSTFCDQHVMSRMEREYVQLHRDTTVQSLTVAPTLVDGVLTYQDSPLVKACKEGRVIMIDEADKAPLEVMFPFANDRYG